MFTPGITLGWSWVGILRRKNNSMVVAIPQILDSRSDRRPGGSGPTLTVMMKQRYGEIEDYIEPLSANPSDR
jgi:hypothetical protein